VEEMMVEGYDPHLELAKFAGALTQQQVDAHKDKTQDHSDVRYLYKTANYSCTYGVGAAKMALTLDIPEDHAKSIIDAFWDKNWAVKKFAEDCMTKTIGQQMWVYNPVSGFWYSLRYEKDIFSTVNQGTGSYCFDLWLKCIKDRYPEISGQFHDEGIWQIPIDKEQDFEKILQDSIQEVNDKLKLNVELKVDIQFGDTYADVH
jgi:DNA polymerase I-like protein with 3'-5' exonuclease and polymerase domains